MKIFLLFTIFLGVANALSFEDLGKYREICKKEEGVKQFDAQKENCIISCTLAKMGIISKDGKFTAASYNDSEKKLAKECFERFKALEPCKRASEFFFCVNARLRDKRCSEKLGYSFNNPDDPKRKCADRCILMDLEIITPKGDLNEAMLDPKTKHIEIACFAKYKNEDSCIRISKYNACVVLAYYDPICRIKLGKTPDADCVSACALEYHGDLSDKYQLIHEKIPVAYRSEAINCYESATRFKKCKLAADYRKCLYKDLIN